ncbi:MAG: carboxymuconolactone decarboxylase family protein, partial [Flavobacteriales bacterium]|nr:carboxymuconolactone decarboxylase family protein [Flavobacteriales bacterium]
MKYLTLLLLSSSLFLNAQTNDESYNELLKKSPFNEMYPKYMAQEAAEYFTVFNSLFTEKSPIAPKEARLAAIAVSAAIKCEYCVS